jgi:Cu-Zn family superoxide dismutase
MKVAAIITATILAFAATPALAQTAGKATLKNADGKDVGTAELSQLPNGVLIRLSLKGVPAGEHAFHVHQTGKCEPPFTSAGGISTPATRNTA